MNYLFTHKMGVGFALCLLASSAFGSVSVDWVEIGNAGNAAQNPANRTHNQPHSLFGSFSDGLGSVAYTYRIARNETTIANYVQFLNATAASDPRGLYHPAMSQDVVTSGISRSGDDGSYTYSAIGSAARPIAYVTWYDAARFANWLHHDQPTGPTAAGLIEDGAYTLNSAIGGATMITKNADARVWIPTANEWYKAAYYDPTHINGTGGYWLHANQSDTMTSNIPADSGAANYYNGVYAVTQNPNVLPENHLTDVGAYGPDSASFYGINDMGGNLAEWNDLEALDINGDPARGLFGGAWFETAVGISSADIYTGTATGEGDFTFRLASIPEPTSMMLVALAGCVVTLRRKRC